jgi:hypothetical protein
MRAASPAAAAERRRAPPLPAPHAQACAAAERAMVVPRRAAPARCCCLFVAALCSCRALLQWLPCARLACAAGRRACLVLLQAHESWLFSQISSVVGRSGRRCLRSGTEDKYECHCRLVAAPTSSTGRHVKDAPLPLVPLSRLPCCCAASRRAHSPSTDDPALKPRSSGNQQSGGQSALPTAGRRASVPSPSLAANRSSSGQQQRARC